MVGYNRIPTPVVSEPTLGFLAALAKRRRGSQQPRSDLSLLPSSRASRRFPSSVPHRPRLPPPPPPPPLDPAFSLARPSLLRRRAIKLPLSLVRPPLTRSPADYSTAHTVRKPPRHFPPFVAASLRHPLSPCGHPPATLCVPPCAGSKETRDRFEFKLPNEHEVTTRQI